MSDDPSQKPGGNWDEQKTLPGGPGEKGKTATDLYLEKGKLNISQLGEFRILREVGRGSMGVVYKAEQVSLRRTVALKILPHSVDLDRKTLKRFLREAESLANLDHPNIVPIYRTGVDQGIHYYAMQFIEGPTLSQRNSAEAVPYDVAAKIGADVARALQCAHERGIIHRDIKPANLIFNSSGKVMITDFGLARDESAGTITESGTLIGTPMYMSPEQITGTHRGVDRLSDVYSLGATLYETVVGSPPFKSEGFQATLRRIAEEDPKLPRKMNPRVPKDLETVVMTAMHKDRHRRYSSAGEMADDLERFLKREPLHARPTTILERGFRRVRKHRIPLIVSMVAGLIAVIALGLATTSKSRQESFLEAYRLASEELTAADVQSAQGDPAARERARSHYEKAKILFDEVIQTDPRRMNGHLGRGKAHKELGEDVSALRDFNRAIDLSPQSSESLAQRGILYLSSDKLRDRDLARRDLLAALGLDPDSSEIMLSLGALELESQRIDIALGYLERARGKDPDNPLIYVLLGRVYRARDDLPLARESLLTARGLKPDEELVTVELAEVEALMREQAEQRSGDKSSSPAVSRMSSPPTTEELLAVGTEVFSLLGKPILGPLSPIRFSSGEELPLSPQDGQKLDAGPPYFKGLSNPDILGLRDQSPPSNPGGEMQLPDLTPQFDGIKTVLNTVFGTFYTPAPPKGGLNPEEELAERLASLSRKIELSPDVESYLLRGDLLWKEKSDLMGAEKDYRSALLLSPNDVDVLTRFSLLLVILAERDSDESSRTARAVEAVEMALKVVEFQPGDPDAQFTLGRSYFVAGRVDDAIRTISRLISTHSDSPRFRSFLEEAARYHDAKKSLNSPTDSNR